jgi:hypothetical protein
MPGSVDVRAQSDLICAALLMIAEEITRADKAAVCAQRG